MEFVLTIKKRAKEGDASAQFTLGLAYERGMSVPQDYAVAYAWYCKAAEQGHANAMYMTAHALRTGVGVPISDEAAAHTWFTRAAAAGHAQAQIVLDSWPERGFELPEQNALNATVSDAARTAHRRE